MRYLALIAFLFPYFSLAQISLSTKSKKAIELYTDADNYRVRGQYTQAIQLLNQAIAKDRNFVEAYYRLGLVYISLKDFDRAIENLEKGLSATNDIKKHRVIWYDLGDVYFMTGDYAKAEKYLTLFLAEQPTARAKIDRANLLLRNIAFAKNSESSSNSIKKRKLGDTINNFVLQYFPVLTADQNQMIFTRRLGPGGNDDEDLVISFKDKNGRWTYPESISENINSLLNEGTCAISADGRKLIFTSCAGRGGYGSCDLYESIKVGNEWSKPRNLGAGVNSAEWESQPSLSADGRTLYFVSDRRSGIGRRDIWISTLNEKGVWTKAVNAGKVINTAYDEISPFIHVNNRTLYFASNGKEGFGGYDLFYSEKQNANFSEPVNLGAGINNHEDQFALYITADGTKGYYSHEEVRPEGYSASFIYEMIIPEEQQQKFKSNYVTGTVRDKATRKPLRADLELINILTNETESFISSDSITGEYLIVLTEGSEYGLYINKKGYLFKSMNFDYSAEKSNVPLILDVDLEKISEGSVATLKNIFFEVDKFDLKDKSMAELNKVIRFLNENPTVKIEISGHTDNTGNEEYNRVLSEKRARAVYQYIIKSISSPERIRVRGYGSSQPVSENTSEKGRAMNRRIEFEILHN